MVSFNACSGDDVAEKGKGEEVIPEPEVDPEATMSFAKPIVTISGAANDFNEITIQSNQTQFTATVQGAEQEWLKAELEGIVLRVTALNSNRGTSVRTAIVTVVAGTGENTASATVSVTQNIWDGQEEDATLTITPSEVMVDSGMGQTASATLTSNKDVFAATVAQGVDWLKAEISGNTLTVTTLSANEANASRSCVVTVIAGVDKTATMTLNVTQKSAVALPSGTEIGAYYQGGIVVHADETVVKVMSVMASPKVIWTPSGSESLLGIPANNSDGAANMAVLKAAPDFATNYPAAKFCADMGEGWYLPSRGEYNLAAANFVAINAVIEQYAGGMPLTSDYLWSSNESSATHAFASRLTDKGAAPYAKKGERFVRCMKDVPVK